MKFLIFQHIDCEHPGSFRQFLKTEGISWDAVNLDQGDQIPALDSYDALWVMGGPMDVWDVDVHPWLIPEKAAIRKWVRELNKPYLGLCLGHQLLADALGGTCGPQRPSEIGVLDIKLTGMGKKDKLFSGTPEVQKYLQWHSVRVAQAPEDAVVLAESDACNIQAMRIGKYAWSMQFHVEVEADTVSNWAEVPAYYEALVSTLGEQGYEAMNRDANVNMDEFLNCSEIIFHNFVSSMPN